MKQRLPKPGEVQITYFFRDTRGAVDCERVFVPNTAVVSLEDGVLSIVKADATYSIENVRNVCMREAAS